MVINVPSSSEKEDYGEGRTIATGSVKLSTYFESSLDIEPELDLHG